MSWINFVSNLLNASHARFIINFNVRLGACNTEPVAIAGIVNCMVFLLVVEHNVLHGVALLRVPAHNAAVETGTEQVLIFSRLAKVWSPG